MTGHKMGEKKKKKNLMKGVTDTTQDINCLAAGHFQDFSYFRG